jgi:hypothetical protein
MLALTCVLLFGFAAAAALGAMTSAIQTNRADIASLSKRYRQAPRELNVSWRIASGWSELKVASRAECLQAWPAAAPESLAA